MGDNYTQPLQNVRRYDAYNLPSAAALPPVAGVLYEPYSQLSPLSGVAVQAHQPT